MRHSTEDVVRMVIKRLHLPPWADADSVCQEIRLADWKRPDLQDGLQIMNARCRAKDYLRAQDPLKRAGRRVAKANGHTGEMTVEYMDVIQTDEAPTPDAVADSTDAHEAVRAALNCLPERDRALLTEIYFKGTRAIDITVQPWSTWKGVPKEKRHLSQSRNYFLKHRALENLKVILESKGITSVV